MRYPCFAIVCLVAITLAACGEKEQMADDSKSTGGIESLVAAERAFAADVKANGIRAGFLDALHPDGILFNPTPTNGVALYEPAPESGALLVWEPRYAEMASSGDLGYTTGPWEYFTSDTASEPVAFGDYFSIWKKDSTGVWKLVLDLGVSRSAPQPMDSLRLLTVNADGVEASFTVEELRMVDSAFADQLVREKLMAYPAHAATDIRLLRDNRPRLIGLDDLSGSDLRIRTTVPVAAYLSAAGDLGYVYGTAEGPVIGQSGDEVPGLGAYVRVWRREGETMKLAAEVMSLRAKQ